MPQRDELLRYLGGLQCTDEMLQILIDGLKRRGSEAILACYGDHVPSLPRAFAHLARDADSNLENWRSDYAIRTGAGGAGRRRDLAAHELGRLVVDLALAPERAQTLSA